MRFSPARPAGMSNFKHIRVWVHHSRLALILPQNLGVLHQRKFEHTLSKYCTPTTYVSEGRSEFSMVRACLRFPSMASRHIFCPYVLFDGAVDSRRGE